MIQTILKGTETLMISTFYKTELYKPCILIPVASMWKLWAFEYFQMDFHGGGHIVGFVTSRSLIEYA